MAPMTKLIKLALLGAALAPLPALAQAAGTLPLLVGSGANGSSFSVPIQTLLFFTALSFLPAILLMMTGFTASSSSCRCCAKRWERSRHHPTK